MSQTPAQNPASVDQPVLPSRNRRKQRLLLMVGVPLLAALVGGTLYLRGGRYVETDNAYVKADKIPVSAEVAGRVAQVLVEDNQPVEAGALLFRLDPAQFEAAYAKAQARLAQVRTELAALKASHAGKQAEIAVARARQAFALKDQQRQAELVARNFVSAARYDDATLNARLTRDQTLALEQDLARIAASLGGRADLPVEQHPSYQAALAELEQARLNLEHVQVRAPQAGTVSKPPKPGQFLNAGSTALALVAGQPWIEANLNETDLSHLHEGQPVTIHVDSYPDRAWSGHVESLSPATGAEFALLPAQNATGNWVKIAQRLPVRIAIDARPELPPLRAGLSTSIEIDTGHQRRLLGLSL